MFSILDVVRICILCEWASYVGSNLFIGRQPQMTGFSLLFLNNLCCFCYFFALKTAAIEPMG